MDITPILEDLNEAQRLAVSAEPSNLLVLAGAGSGKTRVLVHRIAWLRHVHDASPFSILAVTFTNKAAMTMRSRLESLLQKDALYLSIGTFHSFCHRILRSHWREAGLDQHFQIMDSDDQLRLIKRIIRELGLDEDYWSAKKIQEFINHKKDAMLRPYDIHTQDVHTQTLVKIYATYEDVCKRSSLIDFNELMLRVFELWRDNKEVLEQYRQRYKHILVDEFQDTNTLQYEWLRLLAGTTSHVMIVGDDDQSIYGWRGARVDNIHRFIQDFANVQTIRLEQNYRSTQTILNAANAVISCNSERLGKELWTEKNEGEPISVYTAFNEIDEARFVADRIQSIFQQGHPYQDIAILYRSNAQSRVLEEALIRSQIPYRIYGGFRFFERAEIKDALAYLRLLNSVADDAAFERVVNVPARGIGDRTLSLIRDYAREHELSLWQAAHNVIEEKLLTGKSAQSLLTFFNLIEELGIKLAELELYEQVEGIINMSGLLSHYAKEGGEKARARIENLEELVSAARQFVPPHESNLSLLAEFLAHASLEAGEEQAVEHDAVQLMTLHSAKGLEFPFVFICGVEEGLFPHPMSAEDANRLEEERRLFYVGITRARQILCLTYAEIRRMHGVEHYHKRSRFIEEIPEYLMQEIRMRGTVSRPMITQRYANNGHTDSTNHSQFRIGQRVIHPSFGEGVILNYEGSGAHARLQVNFRRAGVKWLVEAYAKLDAAD